MLPKGWKPFGGGGETSLHPAALAILICGVLLIWLLPRRHMLKPFVAVAVLIPLEQQVVLFGLHFMVLRILILCAWVRIAPRLWKQKRFMAGGRQAIDVAFTVWVLWSVISYTLLWGDAGALVVRLGFLYNAFGLYFLFRHLVRDEAEMENVIRLFGVLCAVISVLMITEQITGRNVLSMFGAPELAEIRQGRIRSQGSFGHSIIAGTVGAFFIPVFLGLWQSGRSRAYAALGFCASTLMILTSASSTPVGALLAGFAAFCIWPVRAHMRIVRWGAAAAIAGLHIVMKAPVWSLLGRVHLVGGSTSWHRFALIDQCINRVGEWWLIGTRDNAAWGYDIWDTSNSYVGCAVRSGLLGLCLFIAVISLSFRNVGLARRARTRNAGNKKLAWGLGSGLFASAVAFLGIELFDQSIVFWYALLAMIAAARAAALASRETEAVEEECAQAAPALDPDYSPAG
jgi:hypothetical protein